MSSFSHTLKRSCVAFALRATRSPSVVRPLVSASLPFSSSAAVSSTTRSIHTTRLMATFSPGAPPGTNGTPVFNDIDFSIAKEASSESVIRNADTNAVFVVTGASRGLGLEFVKQLVDRTKGTIVACCRTPESAVALQEYISGLPDADRVQVVPLDVEDQSSIEAVAVTIKDRFGRVDALLNVAGLLGDAKTTPGPERSLTKMDRDWLEKTMAVNVIGPVMLSKELAPLMMQRRKKKDSRDRAVAVIANLSARVGSISDNGMGGWYSYRMSKAALNQATRTMALELKRNSTWTVALHPGTTDTDLSKPFQANVKADKLFPVDFTVSQLLDIVDAMTVENSGGFYDWSGQALSF